MQGKDIAFFGLLGKVLSTEKPYDPMLQGYLFPTALAIILWSNPKTDSGATGGHSATRSTLTHE
jgi:hypothetical protein